MVNFPLILACASLSMLGNHTTEWGDLPLRIPSVLSRLEPGGVFGLEPGGVFRPGPGELPRLYRSASAPGKPFAAHQKPKLSRTAEDSGKELSKTERELEEQLWFRM